MVHFPGGCNGETCLDCWGSYPYCYCIHPASKRWNLKNPVPYGPIKLEECPPCNELNSRGLFEKIKKEHHTHPKYKQFWENDCKECRTKVIAESDWTWKCACGYTMTSAKATCPKKGPDGKDAEDACKPPLEKKKGVAMFHHDEKHGHTKPAYIKK